MRGFSGMSVQQRLMASAAAIAVVASANPAMAQTRTFNVPAGSAARTIPTFAQQAGVQIVASGEAVKRKRTKAVRGSFTVEEGLRQLLANTGLEANAPAASGGIITVKASEVGNGRSSAANEDYADGESMEKIPEILVTARGSNTLNADIRRTEDDPQPYVVLDKKAIEESGARDLSDFIKTRLPSASSSNFAASPGPLGNTSSINLRGLGTSQTLVLINGRRASNVSFNGVEGQPDLNGIPLSAIERIEVLPTTASGIYGGSATGGVINVILRRDYQGFDLKLGYENGFAGGAGRYRIDGSGGFSLEGGKTTVFFAGSYTKANPLTRGERGFFADYLADYYAGTIVDSPPFPAFLPVGSTTNIYSPSGNLVLDNGTPLNSQLTSVPIGYAGPSSDNGAALVARAGQLNLAPANSANAGGNDFPILIGSKTLALTGNIRRDFGSSLKLFVDASYARNKAVSPFPESVLPFTLAADAPSNPFQQAVTVSVPTASVKGMMSVATTDLKLTGGAIFDLPFRWRGEFDYTWDRQTYKLETQRGFNSAAATAAIASGALNVFRDTDLYPIDLSPYFGAVAATSPQRSRLHDATLRLGGPVGRLPGGEPQVTLLLENRETKRGAGTFYLPGPNLTQYFPARSQSVQSAYGEVRLPLVSAQNRMALVEELEVQLSARHDRYTSRGVTGAVLWPGRPDTPPTPFPTLVRATNKVQSTDFTVAFKWKPTDDVALRASYGTGFTPPSVDQLASSAIQSSLVGRNLIDPLRGNTIVAQGTFLNGGNANLKPEQSRSWSAGLIVTPRILPGFRLSLDYSNIRKTDNILSFPGGAQALINADAQKLIAGRVARGTPSAADVALGWAGPIQFVDLTVLNIARAEVEAYDLQLDYEIQTGIGTFKPFVIGTYLPQFRTQTFASQPIVENAGYTGVLKWKGNIGLNWSHDAWSAGWVATYFDSYLVYPGGTTPSEIQLQYVNFQQGPDLRIPSQIYHDLNISYKLSEGLGILSGGKIQLGIRNLFGKKPPRDSQSYSPLGDPRLASYWMSLNMHF